MQQAVDDSGLTVAEIMKEMGYTSKSTFGRWAKGQSQATFHDFAELGRITGKSFSWFFKVDEESEDEAQFLVDLLATILWRLLNGEGLAESIVGEVGDPAIISPPVRRLLEDMEGTAREELTDMTQGWIDLPPAERRRRLRRLVIDFLEPEV